MSELKCCPFCGAESRLYGNSKLIGTKLKHYQVAVCTNDDCGCRTSPCETVEDAIYKWNTRTPMSNIVEKLEEAEKKGSELIGKPHMDSHVLFGWGCAMKTAIETVKKEGVKNDRS